MKKVDCPRCGGYPELDEDGRVYSCYFCGDSGLVPEYVAAEEARSQSWGCYVAAEAAIKQRVALGVPAGWRYYFDEYEGGVVMIPPRELTAPKAWGPDAVSVLDDDIPF